jgi:hypothetical protein
MLRRSLGYWSTGKRSGGGGFSPTLGKDWFFPSTKPSALTYTSIAYNGSRLVIVADGGTNPVASSDDLGTTWTQRTATNVRWRAVTYSPDLDLFCAVALSGTFRVMTSPDGITWTDRTASQANTWLGVTWGNGLFVAVSGGGTNRVMTSPDGITWTNRIASVVADWRDVEWIPDLSLFVAVGNGQVMTSPDGINWTTRTGFTGFWGYDIAYNGSNIVVADFTNNTTISKYSNDGINWFTSSLGTLTGTGAAVAFGQDKFIALRLNDIHYSTDNGVNWDNTDVVNPSGQGSLYSDAIYAGNRFIGLGNGTEFIILSE